MSPEARAVCRELLHLSYSGGFDSAYPLAPIAAALGVTAPLYDEDSETGLLADLVRDGFLSVAGQCASVAFDARDLLENWSREPVAVQAPDPRTESAAAPDVVALRDHYAAAVTRDASLAALRELIAQQADQIRDLLADPQRLPPWPASVQPYLNTQEELVLWIEQALGDQVPVDGEPLRHLAEAVAHLCRLYGWEPAQAEPVDPDRLAGILQGVLVNLGLRDCPVGVGGSPDAPELVAYVQTAEQASTVSGMTSFAGLPIRAEVVGEISPAEEQAWRAGDIVRHKPSGEEWTVAFVENGRLHACGWPPGSVPVTDCELVSAVSDARAALIALEQGRAGISRGEG